MSQEYVWLSVVGMSNTSDSERESIGSGCSDEVDRSGTTADTQQTLQLLIGGGAGPSAC